VAERLPSGDGGEAAAMAASAVAWPLAPVGGVGGPEVAGDTMLPTKLDDGGGTTCSILDGGCGVPERLLLRQFGQSAASRED